MAVRGHADPSYVVDCLIDSGTKRGVIRQAGVGYKLNDGTPFDPNNIQQVLAAVKRYNNVYSIDPETRQEDTSLHLREQVKYLQELSEKRADSVRNTVVGFAGRKQWQLDPSQIKAVGAGATEPV